MNMRAFIEHTVFLVNNELNIHFQVTPARATMYCSQNMVVNGGCFIHSAVIMDLTAFLKDPSYSSSD